MKPRPHNRVTSLEAAFSRGRKAATTRGLSRSNVPYKDPRMAAEWERGYDTEKRRMGR